jgi:hypothetical protein
MKVAWVFQSYAASMGLVQQHSINCVYDEAQRILEEENNRLKPMYAHAQMDNEVLKEALEKKF